MKKRLLIGAALVVPILLIIAVLIPVKRSVISIDYCTLPPENILHEYANIKSRYSLMSGQTASFNKASRYYYTNIRGNEFCVPVVNQSKIIRLYFL